MVALLRPHGPESLCWQQNKGGVAHSCRSLESGQGAGGEVKVTRQGREETTKTRGCSSPGKRLRETYFPMSGLSVSSL